MRIPTLILAAAALSACATSTIGKDDAWEAYQAFDEALAAESEPRWSSHLSARIAADLARAPGADRQEIVRQITYPRWLQHSVRHHAKPTAEGACLTVVGTGNDGGPASVSVEYALESGSLKADDFHYQLAEQEQDLPQQAVCPSEFVPAFP